MFRGKPNGIVKAAVASSLLVAGSKVVSCVNSNSNSFKEIALMILSDPWFGSSVSITSDFMPSFSQVTCNAIS